MKIKSFQKCILLVLLSFFTTVPFYSARVNGSNVDFSNKNNDLFILLPDSNAYQGYFYSEDGKFLGRKGTKDEVYITNSQTFVALNHSDSIDARQIYSLTDITGISHSDFLNRVNWAYGEGGGAAADYYASTINNMAVKMGEHRMYVHMNEGVRSTASANIQKYFVDYDGPNRNYTNFISYRNYILDGVRLDHVSRKDLAYYEYATKGNIQVLSGKVEDPTNGAINKAGGIRSINYALHHNVDGQEIVVVKSINKTSNYTSYHVFFELGKKKDTAASEYTLITMENFKIVDKKVIATEIKA